MAIPFNAKCDGAESIEPLDDRLPSVGFLGRVCVKRELLEE